MKKLTSALLSFLLTLSCVVGQTVGYSLSSGTASATIGDITGLGTGAATALGINVGTDGAFVTKGGVAGTPSSETGTNLTGVPESGVTNLTTDLAAKQSLDSDLTSWAAITRGSGIDTFVTTPTLANLNAAITGTDAAAAGANTDLTSLTGITDITGGASNMTITSGTGNSRTLILKTTNGSGVVAAALTLDASQGITSGQNVVAANASALGWSSRSVFTSASNGVIMMSNSGQNDFSRLQFGGTTTSYNAISRNSVNGFTLESGAASSTWNDPTTANSGTVANRYIFGIAAPTLTSTGTSVTNTVASTVYIGGAPIASTNTTDTTPYALNVAGGVTNLAGPVVISPGYTVATLPSTAATGKVTGARAYVTDAVAPTFLGALTGGGSAFAPVVYNGTAWVAE